MVSWKVFLLLKTYKRNWALLKHINSKIWPISVKRWKPVWIRACIIYGECNNKINWKFLCDLKASSWHHWWKYFQEFFLFLIRQKWMRKTKWFKSKVFDAPPFESCIAGSFIGALKSKRFMGIALRELLPILLILVASLGMKFLSLRVNETATYGG